MKYFARARLATLLALTTLAIPAEARIAQHAAATSPSHQQVLPREGGQNFRDLGGYRTADGQTVRWGPLYRSGTMYGLTMADYRYLGSLGIRTVCDLRSTSERKLEPVNWPAGQAPRILADDMKWKVRR